MSDLDAVDLDLIVSAAQDGDRQAVEQLLEALYEPVSRVCRRICGSDADDATQNAVISIVRALPNFDRRSKVTTWAYRIATNASLDELRRRSRRAEPTDLETPTVIAHLDVDDQPHFVDSLADRDALQAALNNLAPDFKAAVVLRDVAGMDYQDIADSLGVPIGTVRSRIARGRRTLANSLHLGNQSNISDVQREQT